MKNFKLFYESQIAICRKEIIQPHPHPFSKHQLKASYISGTKIFERRFTWIFAFQVLGECSFWVSRNSSLQIFFVAATQNMFYAAFWEYIFRKIERVEVNEMSNVFRAKLYCKMSDLILCWRFHFLPENLILVDKRLIWSFSSFTCWSKFLFFGTVLGCFNHSSFKIFGRLSTMVTSIFIQNILLRVFQWRTFYPHIYANMHTLKRCFWNMSCFGK